MLKQTYVLIIGHPDVTTKFQINQTWYGGTVKKSYVFSIYVFLVFGISLLVYTKESSNQNFYSNLNFYPEVFTKFQLDFAHLRKSIFCLSQTDKHTHTQA
jgi:hypothetical protein